MPKLINMLGKYRILICIVVIAFCLRLHGITNSLTDWHSFRQADTASVTREYVKHGIDLLRPRYHDLGDIQSGLDNPEGYRMVEFPFVNAALAVILRAVPFFDLVVVSRLASILASLGTIISLYFLGKRWANEQVGLLAALTYAVVPYFVFYSRVILPEPFFTFFLTFAVLAFDAWLEGKDTTKWAWYLASFASLSLALLLKPFALFFAPIFVYLAIRHFKFRVFIQPALYLFLLTLVPLYAWRQWIEQFPAGVPESSWLFNKDFIRLRPAWFRWLVWERYTKLILGGAGILLAALGVTRRNQLQELIVVWGACVLGYLIVIAGGNVQHDYYQSITLPLVALAVGQGMWSITQLKDRRLLLAVFGAALALYLLVMFVPEIGSTEQLKLQPVAAVIIAVLAAATGATFYNKAYTRTAAIVLTAGIFALAILTNDWFVRGFYGTRADYEIAGEAVRRLTPPDAKIIAPAFANTVLLFQTDRTGWPWGEQIDEKIQQGAEYYVSTAYDDQAKMLEEKYQVIEKTPNHIIIKFSPK